MGNNRLNGNTTTDIAQRVENLKRLDQELKIGRGYTSGRSGVLAYTIPNNDLFDSMHILPAGVDTDILTLTATGSMTTFELIQIENVFTANNQTYPIATPFLQIFANGLEMVQDTLTGSYIITDGSTWTLSVYFDYLVPETSYVEPNVKSWHSYLVYAGTVPIDMQIKMRIKTTDKGTIVNTVVVY